jgi:hypothetical protein
VLCGQIDIGNAATSTTRGRLQATGPVEAEPCMDVEHEANFWFMTVTAPKMPYIGRG